MPLILKRNDHTDQGDRFRVYSGKAVVGMLMRVPNGEKAGWVALVYHRLPHLAHDLGPTVGMSPSQDRPGRTFANRWRLQLDWAGLRDKDAEERVRLP